MWVNLSEQDIARIALVAGNDLRLEILSQRLERLKAEQDCSRAIAFRDAGDVVSDDEPQEPRFVAFAEDGDGAFVMKWEWVSAEDAGVPDLSDPEDLYGDMPDNEEPDWSNFKELRIAKQSYRVESATDFWSVLGMYADGSICIITTCLSKDDAAEIAECLSEKSGLSFNEASLDISELLSAESEQ